ncbi:MAG: AAA family ATPase [Lentisphaerae bacterium]|jgi:hypothetical protein|nr:AAA family ATPase [Lentisphaerota bacterium]MBT4820620.1 AAA family ATPase [Lentisphaerota bacterium]MBT5612829.1 AAA family ATPase [Lentisphaerota bacterium]MBT7059845.1 AAA family ATPase [Lentisphaerota bacterium]MBT7846075.1 AAA family ATPase [Lentisphaerota bacterium]
MSNALLNHLDDDARAAGCLQPSLSLPGRLIGELTIPDPDPDELIRNRLISRGGGTLLVSSTEAGKSSLAMQVSICWTAGVACFGLEPVGPLPIWVIQAENDDGDVVEERDGISRGLVRDGLLTQEQVAFVHGRLRIITETTRYGDAFGGWLQEQLSLAQEQGECPHLIVIDPALSFLGGDASLQRDVTHFLRGTLNPILKQFGTACLLVHHTNKSGWQRDRKVDSPPGDKAYLGSGSAEWANWARAVLVIEKTADPGLFILHAAKRGKRLNWQRDGKRTHDRHIAHAGEGEGIYWREPSPEEVNSIPTTKINRSVKVVDLDEVAGMARKPIAKSELQHRLQEKLGVGRDRVRGYVKACIDSGRLAECTVRVNPHFKLVGPLELVEKEARRQEEEYRQRELAV